MYFVFIWIFWIFFRFFFYFFFFFKVTKVTTKSYRGYYWTPKISCSGLYLIVPCIYSSYKRIYSKLALILYELPLGLIPQTDFITQSTHPHTLSSTDTLNYKTCINCTFCNYWLYKRGYTLMTSCQFWDVYPPSPLCHSKSLFAWLPFVFFVN